MSECNFDHKEEEKKEQEKKEQEKKEQEIINIEEYDESAQKYLKVCSHPNIFMGSLPNKHPPAQVFIRLGTKTDFYLSNGQMTISDKYEKYDEFLNDIGKQLYILILIKAAAKKFDGELDVFAAQKVSSGFWIPNKSSPYYDPKMFGSIHTENNVAFFIKNGSGHIGKVALFYHVVDDEKWCYDIYGKLYKLNIKEEDALKEILE